MEEGDEWGGEMGLITTGGVEVCHCPFVGGCGHLCVSMSTHHHSWVWWGAPHH